MPRRRETPIRLVTLTAGVGRENQSSESPVSPQLSVNILVVNHLKHETNALWRRYSWFESMRGSHSTFLQAQGKRACLEPVERSNALSERQRVEWACHKQP